MNAPCEHHKTCGDCHSPNQVRTLETAIENLVNGLAKAAEWNLATLDELVMQKSSSKTRIRRQQSICADMLLMCVPPEVSSKINFGHGFRRNFPRVQKLLDQAAADPSRSLKDIVGAWVEDNK